MLNVSDVKEESITEYLVWKWREIDARFKYVNVSTFTRHEESTTTGADFELELWLVRGSHSLPLLFQAKKLAKPYDSYVRKLLYPGATKGQLSKLLSYAHVNGYLPFYAFYTVADAECTAVCGGGEGQTGGVFMLDAYTAEQFADGKRGKRVSKGALIGASNPFHCMFCCPLKRFGYSEYLRQYFPATAQKRRSAGVPSDRVPYYAQLLLTGDIDGMEREQMIKVIEKYELRSRRIVAVYDLRTEHEGA